MKSMALVALLGLSGCANFWPDVKATAKVCTPQIAPDVEQAMPYVLTYIACVASRQDCTTALNDLKAAGTADAIACANAELHEATVQAAK